MGLHWCNNFLTLKLSIMTFDELNTGIKELFESTKFLGDSFLFAYYLDIDINEGQSFSNFCEEVIKQIDESSIIYYSTAINFLAENDNSLSESMTIASEYGYEVENINSELLATLLLQKKLLKTWAKISDEVEDLFDQYKDSKDEE